MESYKNGREKKMKLRRFCQENGIAFNVNNKQGECQYTISFVPDFLDEVECNVVKYLNNNKIPYNFFDDGDGTHHYEFNKFIDFSEYCKEYEMPDLMEMRRTKIKNIDKEIQLINQRITYLENFLANDDTNKGGRWKRLLKYIWKPYRNKIKRREEMLNQIELDKGRKEKFELEKQMLKECGRLD